MERTLKTITTKPRQGQDLFVLPGASEAEPWEVWAVDDAGQSQCVRTCPSPRDNPWPRKSTLVFPVAQVLCLPLWLNETSPDRLPEMIELQIESRGLGSRGADPVYQWEIVAREEKRTLVLIGILPSPVPEKYRLASYRNFDVSIHYFAWPKNAMTIWREQGKLGVTFTHHGNVIYFQTLGDEQCLDRTLQSLVCLRASLEIQQVLPALAEIVVYAELAPEELAALSRVMALPARRAEAPAPRPPVQPWNLCPPEVRRSARQKQARRWKGQALGLAAAICVLALAFLLARYFVTASRVKGLQQWQAEQAEALDSVDSSRAEWQRLAPVVETNDYPLEVLLQVARAMPKDELHLTLFEVADGKVQIRGEATNIAAAYVFFDRLKSGLAAYRWQMDEPHLLPNDLAQLQIEGTLATAHP